MKWIKWSQWTNEGMVNFGQMPVREVQKNLQNFEIEARTILEKTGADHVLYGVKLFDNDQNLEEVKFYLQPMDEATFDKDVASIPRVQVYAVHAAGRRKDG